MDGFNYVLSDGTDQVEGSITIDVTPVNDPPQLKDPANPPPVWQVTAGQTSTFDILDYYVPGPENESDQTLSLQLALASVGGASINHKYIIANQDLQCGPVRCERAGNRLYCVQRVRWCRRRYQ